MSLVKQLLEFADYTFLRFLLNKYDCEELTYILPSFDGIPNFTDECESFNLNGIQIRFEAGNKIVIVDSYVNNIRYKNVRTTIAEIKYEWKKIIRKNIHAMRNERK